MNERVLEMLKRAYELIRKPGGWMRRGFAEDSMGISVAPEKLGKFKPIKFCSDGALYAAQARMEAEPTTCDLVMARSYLIDAFIENSGSPGLGYGDIWAWNDKSTHEVVVAAFRTAIFEAERDLAA